MFETDIKIADFLQKLKKKNQNQKKTANFCASLAKCCNFTGLLERSNKMLHFKL